MNVARFSVTFVAFEFSQDVVNREKEGSHVP